MDRQLISRQIKEKAYEMGFGMVGFSPAGQLVEESVDLEKWLHQGLHGEMSYMENYFDKRTDPRKLVPGSKSVISVIHNYYRKPYTEDHSHPKVSMYAWGEDYHKVLKRKLYKLLAYIQDLVGEVEGRVFVDSAPVMDKAWARRSGLGWIGKHTNLISPQKGSYFFIGEIILDLELEYDGPIKDFCGTCTRCIDACPTEALQPYQIDAQKCISYLTIELKSGMEEQFSDQLEGWVYGCDICQEVCPWNRFSNEKNSEDFNPYPHASLSIEEWEEKDERAFKKLSKKTAMNRIKWEKMKHNLKMWKLWRAKFSKKSP